MVAILFPGQGTQRVGMGRKLYAAAQVARDVFHEACDVLHLDLTKLCFEGPPEVLTRTEIAQPAIFTCNAAAFAVLGDDARPGVVAGHSLGEFNALVAAGALSRPEALALVRRRGQLMSTVEARGAMASVVGLDEPALERICRDVGAGDEVVVALVNAPDRIVVSGRTDAVARCCAAALAAGARSVSPLAVSHAFHSPLMAGIAPAWSALLEDVEFQDAEIPVVQNVSGHEAQDAETLKAGVRGQLTGAVQWVRTLERLVHLGYQRAIECGDRVALGPMARFLGGSLVVASVETAKQEAALIGGGAR